MRALAAEPDARTPSVTALANSLAGTEAAHEALVVEANQALGARRTSIARRVLDGQADERCDLATEPDCARDPWASSPAGQVEWEDVIDQVATGDVAWIDKGVVARSRSWFSGNLRETILVQQPVVREVRRRFRRGWVSPSLGTMRWVPTGTFVMGSPPTEVGRYEDEFQHTVSLTREFLMMEHPVTQQQWRAVMGNNPSHFKTPGGQCPVEKVSWHDVQAFIMKVQKRDGILYRLPTEAEWEYAARGGEDYVYAGSDDVSLVAWYKDNSGARTHPVGLKYRNGFGLYDMSGNVWEWVADWFGAYPREAVTDPLGPVSGTHKVYRGGGWFNGAQNVRVADRLRAMPNRRHDDVGFRLVAPT